MKELQRQLQVLERPYKKYTYTIHCGRRHGLKPYIRNLAILELSVCPFIGKYTLVSKKASSAVLLDSTVFSSRLCYRPLTISSERKWKIM
jgi:hypothetical protein